MGLLGQLAPDFEVPSITGTTIGSTKLSAYQGKYVVLFFYPCDFTFVCPTELHGFQERLSAFTERNAVVLGCSVDSIHAHYAWLQQPKAEGGIQGVTYPLLADGQKTLARSFDVLNEEGVTYRATFIIDQKGIIRHATLNDLGLGRNLDEYIRLLDALQFTEKHGEVCPANWQKGDRSMKASPEGVRGYFKG